MQPATARHPELPAHFNLLQRLLSDFALRPTLPTSTLERSHVSSRSSNMCCFVAGYRLEHEDVVALLKRKELVKPDAKVSTSLAQQRFAEWAVAQIRGNVEGNRMVPWPQCKLELSLV